MAYENHHSSLPGIVAAADYTEAPQRFVTINTDGKAELSAAGARVDAVVCNNPNVDEAAELHGSGDVVKVEASAAVGAGASVSSAADGKARVAAAGDYIAGVCVHAAGAAGELCSVYINNPGKLPA